MLFNRSSELKNWIYLLLLILSSVIIFVISSKEFYPADYNEWSKDWGVFVNYIYNNSPFPFAELSKFTLAYLISRT